MTYTATAASANTHFAKILVVDDHPVVIEGLAILIDSEEMRVQWTASSAAEAMKICEQHFPDLAIVDISLPDRSGIELVRAMHAHRPAMPILVMSMHDEAIYAERAIRAGARGYIMKHTAARQVVEAIRNVQNGDMYVSKNMFSMFIDRMACGYTAERRPSYGSLSDRELQVFELIGAGLTKTQIAKRLRRSANTVEAHRSSIKRKLNVQSSAALARIAFLYSEGRAGACGDTAAACEVSPLANGESGRGP